MGNVSSTNAQAFEFKAPSGQITFDFSKNMGKEHEEQSDNGPDTQAVVRQAIATTANISKPTIFRLFPRLPNELKEMVWKEALRKPGLHFLAVVEPQAPNAMNTNPHTGLPMFQLMEPSGGVSELRVIVTMTGRRLAYGEYYTTYFPEGMKSAYFNWRNIMSICPFGPEFIQEKGMIRPLTIPLHNGGGAPKEAVIDAATDLVYIKFRMPNPHRPQTETYFMAHPIHLVRDLHLGRSDNTNLAGIRHVVLEMPRGSCMFWYMAGPGHFCSWCGFHLIHHDSNVSNLAYLKAKFLGSLPDLESVYLVFPDVKQGPVDPDVDKRYTVTGYPEPLGEHGTDARRYAGQERWESSADPIFRCDGGALRELRGAHIILPLAEILETFQHYYVIHPPFVTLNGQPQPIFLQEEYNQRMNVKFKIAVWVEEE